MNIVPDTGQLSQVMVQATAPALHSGRGSRLHLDPARTDDKWHRPRPQPE